MPQYRVLMKQETTYEATVVADSEDEARELAREEHENGTDYEVDCSTAEVVGVELTEVREKVDVSGGDVQAEPYVSDDAGPEKVEDVECQHETINHRANPVTGADVCAECGVEMAYPLLPGEKPHAAH